jgi:hypothetical protein
VVCQSTHPPRPRLNQGGCRRCSKAGRQGTGESAGSVETAATADGRSVHHGGCRSTACRGELPLSLIHRQLPIRMSGVHAMEARCSTRGRNVPLVPGPRVQLIHGLHTWLTGSGDDAIAWRLLGGNQRELCRSVGGFPDEVAARAAVTALQANLDQVTLCVYVDAGSGQWTWQLQLRETPVVAASRGYQRRRESESNLAGVLSSLAVAALVPNVLDLARHRSGRPGSAMSPLSVRQRSRYAL